MARKSMKSRVPADVWAALTELRAGNQDHVHYIGHGAQGEVFGVDSNEDWVIKRWRTTPSVATYLRTYSKGYWKRWKAKHVAKDIAKGILSSPHLPKVIYATNRYVIMERLEDLADWDDDLLEVWEARDKPYKALPKHLHPVRRALKRLKSRGYEVNDVRETNVMQRKDGTIVLNDVVA